MRFISLLIVFTLTLSATGQTDNALFNEIYDLTEQANYFRAREVYDSNKATLPSTYQTFTEAVLDNAFNRLQQSQQKINSLITEKKSIPKSLQFKLYEIKKDNAVKLYQYKEAKDAVIDVLGKHKKHLSRARIDDFKNDLKIWTALENISPQKVIISESTSIKMVKDLAGLNNLIVSANSDTANFIFDTGANISTTTESMAKRFNMQIIPVQIKVGSITGKQVTAKLAVCKQLIMGHIEFQNVIFLVMPDEGLSFPQINYQIYGILGFPVIEALKEIQITQNGDFIVPQRTTAFSKSSNMAMNQLTPLIYLNGKHFSFDSGADQTMLYHNFFKENETVIVRNHKPVTISFGGAGGKVEVQGYIINHIFTINGKEVTLKNVQVLKEKIKKSETVYGNIGQDLIRQFNSMTLNFEKMFIRFE